VLRRRQGIPHCRRALNGNVPGLSFVAGVFLSVWAKISANNAKVEALAQDL